MLLNNTQGFDGGDITWEEGRSTIDGYDWEATFDPSHRSQTEEIQEENEGAMSSLVEAAPVVEILEDASRSEHEDEEDHVAGGGMVIQDHGTNQESHGNGLDIDTITAETTDDLTVPIITIHSPTSSSTPLPNLASPNQVDVQNEDLALEVGGASLSVPIHNDSDAPNAVVTIHANQEDGPPPRGDPPPPSPNDVAQCPSVHQEESNKALRSPIEEPTVYDTEIRPRDGESSSRKAIHSANYIPIDHRAPDQSASLEPSTSLSYTVLTDVPSTIDRMIALSQGTSEEDQRGTSNELQGVPIIANEAMSTELRPASAETQDDNEEEASRNRDTIPSTPPIKSIQSAPLSPAWNMAQNHQTSTAAMDMEQLSSLLDKFPTITSDFEASEEKSPAPQNSSSSGSNDIEEGGDVADANQKEEGVLAAYLQKHPEMARVLTPPPATTLLHSLSGTSSQIKCSIERGSEPEIDVAAAKGNDKRGLEDEVLGVLSVVVQEESTGSGRSVPVKTGNSKGTETTGDVQNSPDLEATASDKYISILMTDDHESELNRDGIEQEDDSTKQNFASTREESIPIPSDLPELQEGDFAPAASESTIEDAIPIIVEVEEVEKKETELISGVEYVSSKMDIGDATQVFATQNSTPEAKVFDDESLENSHNVQMLLDMTSPYGSVPASYPSVPYERMKMENTKGIAILASAGLLQKDTVNYKSHAAVTTTNSVVVASTTTRENGIIEEIPPELSDAPSHSPEPIREGKAVAEAVQSSHRSFSIASIVHHDNELGEKGSRMLRRFEPVDTNVFTSNQATLKAVATPLPQDQRERIDPETTAAWLGESGKSQGSQMPNGDRARIPNDGLSDSASDLSEPPTITEFPKHHNAVSAASAAIITNPQNAERSTLFTPDEPVLSLQRPVPTSDTPSPFPTPGSITATSIAKPKANLKPKSASQLKRPRSKKPKNAHSSRKRDKDFKPDDSEDSDEPAPKRKKRGGTAGKTTKVKRTQAKATERTAKVKKGEKMAATRGKRLRLDGAGGESNDEDAEEIAEESNEELEDVDVFEDSESAPPEASIQHEEGQIEEHLRDEERDKENSEKENTPAKTPQPTSPIQAPARASRRGFIATKSLKETQAGAKDTKGNQQERPATAPSQATNTSGAGSPIVLVKKAASVPPPAVQQLEATIGQITISERPTRRLSAIYTVNDASFEEDFVTAEASPAPESIAQRTEPVVQERRTTRRSSGINVLNPQIMDVKAATPPVPTPERSFTPSDLVPRYGKRTTRSDTKRETRKDAPAADSIPIVTPARTTSMEADPSSKTKLKTMTTSQIEKKKGKPRKGLEQDAYPVVPAKRKTGKNEVGRHELGGFGAGQEVVGKESGDLGPPRKKQTMRISEQREKDANIGKRLRSGGRGRKTM